MELFNEIIRHEVSEDPTNPVITGEFVQQLLDGAFSALEEGDSVRYHSLMDQAQIYGKFLDIEDPRNPDYTP